VSKTLDRTQFTSDAMRVVTIIDALWVEISDEGCPHPVGGLWNYRWPPLWAVCDVAGSSVGELLWPRTGGEEQGVRSILPSRPDP
jgi:hypothetical protein